jgi:phage terminase large subunit
VQVSPQQFSVIQTYQPFEKQAQFHASPAKFRLFGGAAGPGKTAALVWEAVMQNLEVEGSTVLLLRRTLGQLEDSLLKEFHKSVPWRKMGARYNDQKHRVTWPNGSILRFGYCENENDVYQYQGAEFLFIGLDELTHFTLKQWQFLTSRNRHPGQFATMAGATNPGNIGHEWVNALWGCDGNPKRPAPGMDEPEKYDPKDYDFIRALIADNPIYANDQNYLKTLDGLGKVLRTAMLEGLWDQFAGQYFDVFLQSRHVAKWQGADLIAKVMRQSPAGDWEQAGIQTYRIDHQRVGNAWHPAPWVKWVSLDWGREHPAAVYWHTTAPDGRHITYREWVQAGLTPRMLGAGIVERSVDSERRAERIQQFFVSPDANQDRTGQSTIFEQIREQTSTNHRLPDPAEASDDRVAGWQLLYTLLQDDGLLIAENCEKLIKSLPILIHDAKKVEDVKKIDGDDPADALRYGYYSRLGAAKIPLAVRAATATQYITDPTERAIMLEKFHEKEAKAGQPAPIASRHGSGRRWRPGQGR